METDPIRAPAPTRLRYFNFSSILTKTRIELRVLGFNKFMFLPKVHVLNHNNVDAIFLFCQDSGLSGLVRCGPSAKHNNYVLLAFGFWFNFSRYRQRYKYLIN